jgi:hypothetical protein
LFGFGAGCQNLVHSSIPENTKKQDPDSHNLNVWRLVENRQLIKAANDISVAGYASDKTIVRSLPLWATFSTV